MEIKFKKSINEFKYVIMFDLASKNTGVCIWDITNNRPIKTKWLQVSNKEELPAAGLNTLIDNFFNSLNEDNIDLKDVLVYKEAMPTQVHGGASTIKTFLALARSHAVLDLYCYTHNIAIFDYTGISPITWHYYFLSLKEWERGHPVEKTDVRDYLYETYGMSDLSLDESDAVFLAKTFLDIYWDNQITEQIKEVKRHRKTLKAPHAINACDQEIERLNGLKIHKK